MQAPLLHTVRGQRLWLSAERCLFWEEQRSLILSDLHLGKTGHFRKAGIAVPQGVYREDLQRLVALIQHFAPARLLVVGDFFHSRQNAELDLFRRWRDSFPDLEIRLVRGNHDILAADWYRESGIEVSEPDLLEAPFYFSHEDCGVHPQAFTFCGHLHPGIQLDGIGRQRLRLPCFYFSDTHCILPAFSRFTGTALVWPKKEDRVFALADNRIIAL